MKKILCVILTLLILTLAFSFTSCLTNEVIKLEQYSIIIPENADITTKYCAENFSNLVFEKTGAKLEILTDNEEEKDEEFLIGETNREESKTDTELQNGQYVLFKQNKKIVMKGYGIYVGASCGDFVNKYAIAKEGKFDISKVPIIRSAFTYTPEQVYTSVIFMIGDGMGDNHIKMSEENANFSFVAKSFPNIGISVTRSLSVINKEAKFTDSAASGTAMATGYKTINGHVGLDKDQNVIKNVRELASEKGAKTGIITTDLITGATPSSYMCHNISRENTDELQTEIDALVSGGLIDYCQGDVGNELTTKVKEALATLSSDNSNFFLMVEEGQIDKHSHDKDAQGVIDTVKRFDDAIAYATQFALCHPSVALVVTADHETGNLVETAPKNYYFGSYNHTNKNVPIFAIGAGTTVFNEQKIENTTLAQFCAMAYSNEPFGDSTVYE